MLKLSEDDEKQCKSECAEESHKEVLHHNRFGSKSLFNERLTSDEAKKSQIAKLIKQEIVEDLREFFNSEK